MGRRHPSTTSKPYAASTQCIFLRQPVSFALAGAGSAAVADSPPPSPPWLGAIASDVTGMASFFVRS